MARPKGTHKIDIGSFEEVRPHGTGKRQQPAIRINPSGTLTFSKYFREVFRWQRYTIMVNKPGLMLLLSEAEADKPAFTVPRQRGAVRAHDLMAKLQQRGIPLPARYIMAWREDLGMWVGQLDNTSTAPDAAQRPAPLPRLEDIL